MPYIHCDRCGASCYSNVLSCPRCKLPVRHARSRTLPNDGLRISSGDEEMEMEVRNALYGSHSGCVAARNIDDQHRLETTSRSAPS